MGATNDFVFKDDDLLEYCGNDTVVIVPPQCKCIEANAFENQTQIEEVVLPLGLLEIREYSFYKCTSLKRIEIPETVTLISDCAFDSCESLEEVIIHSKSITFGDDAFYDCRSLMRMVTFTTDVNLPKYSFADPYYFYCPKNSPIIQYAISHKIEYEIIDVDSKYDSNISIDAICANAIVPTDSALEIQGDKLMHCDWPQLRPDSVIEVPASVKHIADGAFKDSGFLAKIILPDGLKTIGKEAFMRCSARIISVPDTVEYIDRSAFEGSFIEEITLPQIQELSPRTFCECAYLKHVVFPESLLKIGANAFSKCYSLEGISLPKRLIEIGEGAFDECASRLYITIPDSVVEIAENAFSGCLRCIFLCNRGSKAWEYMENKYWPVYPYSDEIVANICRREELKENNKILDFNYRGSSITVPSNYAIYYKLLQYYTPKADEIYGKFIKLCERLIHDTPSSISEQFFAMLESLAETAEQDLQSVGIYLKNAKGRLYYTNPALQAMFPTMTTIFDVVFELQQKTLNEMELQKDILFAQAESKVTGVGYGIITNSAVTYAAYAFDDYFERVKQRKSVGQQLKIDLDSMANAKINEFEAQCIRFVKQAVAPTMRRLIDSFVQELFGMVVFYLECYDILPRNTQNMYDHTKADKLLTNDLLSSYQKGTILAKALANCPYNLDVYYHIIDLGFANDTVYQIAAAVGIGQEVTALKGKISTEKEQRRIIEEQRKLEEKRRRERLIAEQQQREAEERERARAEKKRQIETEINSLQDELANLKGFFTGKRKAAIQKKIEELQNALKKV